MRAGGFPGNPGGLVVSILKTAGARAPAHQARGRGRCTWRPTERTAGARMVPPGEGNEARGDGRRGVGVSHSTAETGELSPRDPVEGRGHRQVAPLEGKTANTPEVGSRLHVTTPDSRPGQTRLRDGGGHRLASWTRGYATARSDAVCRGAGCGRTRTSGSVGGQGQQRPWSTRPGTAAAPACRSGFPREARDGGIARPVITQSVRNYSERYKYEISANIPQGLNCYLNEQWMLEKYAYRSPAQVRRDLVGLDAAA